MSNKTTQEDNYSTDAISLKLESLYTLQNIDSEIDRITVLRGELPVEVADLKEEIEKLNERLEKQQTLDDEINSHIENERQKIDQSNSLIEKYNAQQMKVRNNREFDAINKELEFQALEIELSNKKIKSYELDVDSNADKVKLLKAKIKERKKHLKNKNSELADIIKSTEDEEKKLISKKKKCVKLIEPRLYNSYENLRQTSKNGLAVVKIDRGACGGCFNSVTSQHNLNIKLRKNILFCESCGRILVPDDIDQQ
tara:strand:- start:14471 stop:15235 length:765 start_codon:yes stop_codon:yes gene_type:complete